LTFRALAVVVVVSLAIGGLHPASAFAGQQATPPAQTVPPAPAAQKAPSKLWSPEDGWLDISGFLGKKYGFVPIALPITEPAIGIGIAAGITFVGKPSEAAARDPFARPNTTVVGGLGTDNGTWGGLAADIRHWGDNRVQTIFAFIDASVNLDFHGTGETSLPNGVPVSYNLHPVAAIAQAKYRVGGSRTWVGLGYVFSRTLVSFDAPDGTPGLPDVNRESQIGGLSPSFTYDSRDEFFTPGRGTYVEASAGFYGTDLGGDDEFQKLGVVVMQYVPVHPRFTLGVRGDTGFTYGDAPFYIRPFVSLRGAPVMRYQRDNLGQVEAELRWQFWKRFSAVGFAGYGVVWNNLDTLERKLTVTTGGAGFRYEIARQYKLHMGADFAYGPDGPAFYIQFGSAWIRP
jgi:hypothetical protein